MAPEPVHIMRMPHRCHVRWARVGQRGGAAWAAHVSVGVLDDGSWYVWVTGPHSDGRARLYPDEESARGVAEGWKRRIGGRWQQVPCYPTAGWQPGERPDQPPDSSGATG